MFGGSVAPLFSIMNHSLLNIAIREATPADVEVILGFIRKKAAFDGVPDWVEATEEMLASELFGPRPAAFVLLAAFEGRTVGFAIYFQTFSSFLARPGIWLDDLFVDEDVRGRGVGRALLTYLAKLAQERGHGRIEWVTARDNAKGLEFYQRNGAQVQDVVRVLRLDRPAISTLAQHGAT
jgi:GNAT superfamily N-acetyltransferase